MRVRHSKSECSYLLLRLISFLASCKSIFCFWTRDHLQQLFPSYLQVVVKDFNFKPPFDRPGIQLPYLSIWFRWKEYSGDKAMTSLPRPRKTTRRKNPKRRGRFYSWSPLPGSWLLLGKGWLGASYPIGSTMVSSSADALADPSASVSDFFGILKWNEFIPSWLLFLPVSLLVI